MNGTQNTSELLPLGMALILVVLTTCAGGYALLTCFHPKYRRTFRWGRGWSLQPVGPVLSRWSHATAGASLIVVPFAILHETFGIREAAATVCGIVAGVVSAATIGGMLYDSLVYVCRRQPD